MVLLGDEAQVETHFGPFRDAGSVGARYVHGWRQTVDIILDAPDGTLR